MIRSGFVLLCLSALLSADAAFADAQSPDRRPAVAAPNAQFITGYAFSHVNRTSSQFFDSGTSTTSTLRIRATDAHDVRLALVGTLPVLHSVGVRGKLRGSFGGMRQNVDLFEPGNDGFDAGSYGVAAETFLRDPELGSLTLGASYDRLEGNDGFDANQFGGTAAAAIFFPDMGKGALDWFLGFDYAHRGVSGPRRAEDVDLYKVRGGAAWYLTENFRLAIGGGWSIADNGTVSEQDSEGFLELRALLPLPISTELFLGGSAGQSAYKESPFSEDGRLIYSANVGVTFRFRSGSTLLEAMRAHD